MSDVAIRPARADDLPCLAPIDASGGETFARYGQPLADGGEPEPPEHWAPALEAGLLWVAEDARDGPIGFLAAELADEALHVEQVDVVMERQRQGVGRRLMQAAIDAARARGLSAVTLTTFRSIPWNGPFYASMGFVELGPPDLPPHLGAHLANEVARGFTDRCGMRLPL